MIARNRPAFEPISISAADAHPISELPIASEASISPTIPLLRLGIHDASRLEWSISVPLPENRPLHYTLDVELEIPANAFARHTPWDHLQSFTRLDGPSSDVGDKTVSIDSMRRGAVAAANSFLRAVDALTRQCRLASSVVEPIAPQELENSLVLWVEALSTAAAEGRQRWTLPAEKDAAELFRERKLVDEYISIRVLKAFASVERALMRLPHAKSPHREELLRISEAVERRLADALKAELEHRERRGFLNPDPKSPKALEKYIERGSQLKKHFQEVLFLEAESYQVADRIHHWVAAFVAVIASTWAFAWQIAFMSQRPTTTSSVGSGIILLAVIAGLVYAAKDRIKELGRNWISGNVHRLYAQRVSSFRAPERRVKSREVVVKTRESFDVQTRRRPDPLNPESGASVNGTVLHYAHRGTVFPLGELRATEVQRIKHVFRYDLSPVFTRLDDAVKQVPVLAVEDHRVRFIDAPRCYRVPFRVRIRCNGHVKEEIVHVVMHKRGLDRLEKARRMVEQKESGIEPDHKPE